MLISPITFRQNAVVSSAQSPESVQLVQKNLNTQSQQNRSSVREITATVGLYALGLVFLDWVLDGASRLKRH